MALESDIKHLEREKTRQLVLVPAKTAFATYIGIQTKNGINHYNQNSKAYEKMLQPNLEGFLDDLYITKGMIWIDKKVSSWISTIKKEETKQEKPIPEIYADTAPLLIGSLGFVLAMNSARKRIRESSRLSLILKVIHKLT